MFFLVPGSTASIVMFPMDLVKRQMQMVGLLCSMSLVLVQWWKIVKLIQRETSVKSKNGCLGGDYYYCESIWTNQYHGTDWTPSHFFFWTWQNWQRWIVHDSAFRVIATHWVPREEIKSGDTLLNWHSNGKSPSFRFLLVFTGKDSDLPVLCSFSRGYNWNMLWTCHTVNAPRSWGKTLGLCQCAGGA